MSGRVGRAHGPRLHPQQPRTAGRTFLFRMAPSRGCHFRFASQFAGCRQRQAREPTNPSANRVPSPRKTLAGGLAAARLRRGSSRGPVRGPVLRAGRAYLAVTVCSRRSNRSMVFGNKRQRSASRVPWPVAARPFATHRRAQALQTSNPRRRGVPTRGKERPGTNHHAFLLRRGQRPVLFGSNSRDRFYVSVSHGVPARGASASQSLLVPS